MQLIEQKLDPTVTHQIATIEELDAMPWYSIFLFDVECYPNYFIVCFKSRDTGKVIKFELSPWEKLNVINLGAMMTRFCTVGFNCRNYDLPLVCLAMRGYSNQELYEASCKLIGLIKPSMKHIAEMFSIFPQGYNCVDLIEVCPLHGSLKIYGARLHTPIMHEVIHSPYHEVTAEEAPVIYRYCLNDLDITDALSVEMDGDLKLRQIIGEEYNADLRSKSDAQIAEYMICSEVKKINGRWPKAPEYDPDFTFTYKVPAYIEYEHPALHHALEVISSAKFHLGAGGAPLCPALENLVVNINLGAYRMGIGGLHSSETCTRHIATDDMMLMDIDVRSFYPNIILTQKLFPAHMGKAYLKSYAAIVERRLAAKDAGLLIEAGLKIAINGTFGKLGSMYSALFSPDLLIAVTVGGQLLLLSLVEMLESAGVFVVSANTDGVLIFTSTANAGRVALVTRAWEDRYGLKTESTLYSAFYARDVNNYIGVKPDGKTKLKGVYARVGSTRNSPLSKNPEHQVCQEAAINFLTCGKPVEEFVYAEKDIRQFVSVRSVVGGAHRDGIYLGKAVRWYYSTRRTGCISYVKSGNKVPLTDGAMPLMALPQELPKDLDYEWYIDKAKAILLEVGATRRASLF